MKEIEKILDFLNYRIDFPKRKPDHIFKPRLYPSSGVEIMAEQAKQMEELAKDIEQYLIKARIDEVGIISKYPYHLSKDSISYYVDNRIELLKKGLNNE